MNEEREPSKTGLQRELEELFTQFAQNCALVIMRHVAQSGESVVTVVPETTTASSGVSDDAALLAADTTLINKDQRYHVVMQQLRKRMPDFLSVEENLALGVEHALTQFDEVFKRLNVPFKVLSFHTRDEVLAQLHQVRANEQHPHRGFPFLFFLFDQRAVPNADTEDGTNSAELNEVILWIYVTERQEIIKRINLNEEVIRTPRDAGVLLLTGMVRSDERLINGQKAPGVKLPPEKDPTNTLFTDLRGILDQLFGNQDIEGNEGAST